MSIPATRGSGPVAWAAIIATTCILLFLLQQILWLVVPFLLALILYYMLYPATVRLMLRGMERSSSAAIVIGSFIAAIVLLVVLLIPLGLGHMLDWQATAEHYLLGGVALLDRTLRAIEKSWPYFARAHIADVAAAKLAALTSNPGQNLQPIAVAIASAAPSLFLAPFLAFFLLRDGGRVKRMVAAAVPNAFFEKTLQLMHEVDQTTRAYFVGLMKLTVLDTITLAVGLWIMGMPAPLALGFLCAVLAWLPYFGSAVGGLLVVFVAATDFPMSPAMSYSAIVLFVLVRVLDDFVYMPMTIGKSLHMHPVLTVMMLFIGEAIAGISGLMLALPLLGVVMVVGGTIDKIVTDPRLMARYRHTKRLRVARASADLVV